MLEDANITASQGAVVSVSESLSKGGSGGKNPYPAVIF